jgi:hypothetical protein
VDPDHAQAIVQIFAELAFGDALLQIGVANALFDLSLLSQRPAL